MINPANKEDYTNRSNQLIDELLEVGVLISDIYSEFENTLKMRLDSQYENSPSMPCKSLDMCFDSNAYPNIMIMNMLVFNEPLDLIALTENDEYKNKKLKSTIEGNIAFSPDDIKNIVKSYLFKAYNSICYFSFLPLIESTTLDIAFF